MITTKQVSINPRQAEKWLLSNTDNRPIRREQVDKLAVAMKTGSFALTHQGIGFDTNGKLIDGQHRLAAIVQSGVTLEMLVFYGIPPEQHGIKTMDVVDFGRPRTIPDSLYLRHGIKNAVNVTAIIRGVAKLCHWGFTPASLSVIQAKQIYDLYSMEIERSHNIMTGGGVDSKFVRQSPIMAVIAFAMKVNVDGATEFAEKLISGAELSATSPILTLRRHFLSQAAQSIDTGRGPMMQKTASAMIAFFECREVKIIRAPTGQGIVWLKHRQTDCVAAVQKILGQGDIPEESK